MHTGSTSAGGFLIIVFGCLVTEIVITPDFQIKLVKYILMNEKLVSFHLVKIH
jgi:hypothetical protein